VVPHEVSRAAEISSNAMRLAVTAGLERTDGITIRT
jgi:hypothetical protein